MAGNYVNFGVFELYNDPCFKEALSIVMKLAVAVPPSEMLAYPRVYKAFYALLETLFNHQPAAMMLLDSPTFLHMANALVEGVHHTDIRFWRKFWSSVLLCLLFP